MLISIASPIIISCQCWNIRVFVVIISLLKVSQKYNFYLYYIIYIVIDLFVNWKEPLNNVILQWERVLWRLIFIKRLIITIQIRFFFTFVLFFKYKLNFALYTLHRFLIPYPMNHIQKVFLIFSKYIVYFFATHLFRQRISVHFYFDVIIPNRHWSPVHVISAISLCFHC